jgi:NAD(P)-dependent dehydrogenase (short-subunit alcohol dehydrogenase family)
MREELMKCKDKVALVTGAGGQGMGRSIALTLAREGAKVVVNYKTSGDMAKAIAGHIKAHGGNALALQADIQDPVECGSLVRRCIEEFCQIDICVVNPGGGWHMEPINKLKVNEALEDVRQELSPLYNLMQLVLPGMYERNWGRFIAISLEPSYSSPAYAYNVGKAARSHAVLLAAEQAWEHGVTMNIIGPGPVASIETLEEAIEQCGNSDSWKRRKKSTPQDIGEAVAFLCSDVGKFITGCVIPFK